MDDEMLIYHSKFSRAHVILSFLLFLYLLVQIMGGNELMQEGEVLSLSISLALINTCMHFFQWFRNIKLWFVMRTIELIFITIGFFGLSTSLVSLILGLLLVIVILEIIMAGEYTDVYSRTITLLASGIPALICILLKLILDSRDQLEYFAMICSYISIISFVIFISDLIAKVVQNSDEKVFELRRLTDTMNMTNEALRSQQEKVKRANEELGIQKIKLETAYHKINNANAETTIQNLIMKYISSSLEITTLLNLITESILEAIGLDICAVIIQPEIAGNEGILYQIRTRLGNESEELLSKQLSEGCLDYYITTDGNYINNKVEEGKYAFLYGNQVGSLLIVPLVKESIVQGALICGKAQYEFFHDNIPFFETVVSQLMVAIHNASLYSKLQQMAIRDSLTGIYNRRQLNLLMDQYSKEAKEMNSHLSVALLDIDHFKRINDTYGHLFGDVVIKEIAKYLQDTANKYHGIAARYGGEEFVLVLMHKNISECYEIVEELRQLILQMKVMFEDEIVTAKISVGLASYPETCQHITELLNRADCAMYYSKENGRNQITIDSDKVQDAVKK